MKYLKRLKSWLSHFKPVVIDGDDYLPNMRAVVEDLMASTYIPARRPKQGFNRVNHELVYTKDGLPVAYKEKESKNLDGFGLGNIYIDEFMPDNAAALINVVSGDFVCVSNLKIPKDE